MGDFLNDGGTEFVVAGGNDLVLFDCSVSVILDSLACSEISTSTIVGAGAVSSLKAADFNGDGLLDLAGVDTVHNQLLVLLNSKANLGSFSVTTLPGPPDAGPLVVGDFNGDGIPDLAVGGFDAIYLYSGSCQ
jgi:hypothetical protein